MKIFVVIMVSVLLASCGVPKAEFEAIKAENEQMKAELDEFKNGEARTVALIEKAYQDSDIPIARQNIGILEEYHPEALAKENVMKIIQLVEKEEEKERLRLEEVEKERIRLERLATIGKTADNPLTINGRGQDFNEIAKDIILNRKEYNGKYISVTNTYFDQFGISSRNSFVSSDVKWYDDNETYEISAGGRGALSNTLGSNNFYFFFHPHGTDTAARRLMIDLKGKYYTSPQRFEVTGQFKIVTISTKESNVFHVTQFSLGNNTYNGNLP